MYICITCNCVGPNFPSWFIPQPIYIVFQLFFYKGCIQSSINKRSVLFLKWNSGMAYFISILLRCSWYITQCRFKVHVPTESCPTLCDSMDSCPPGSSLRGISQARIPEWIAIFFSSGSSWPRDRTQV